MTINQSVEIYCCEPSHDGQRYVICRFRLTDRSIFGARGNVWLIETQVEPEKPRLLRGARTVLQVLEGDTYIDAEGSTRSGEEVRRQRYRFHCHLCGLTLVRADAPVHAALDKLAAAGVSSISLSALAANV